MQTSHYQIAKALSGYPCIETIDMSIVEYVEGKWRYKNREFKMTLPPMSCYIRKTEGKSFATLILTVDPVFHQSMIDSLTTLVDKAKDSKAYSPDSELIRTQNEKTDRQNMVTYIPEQKLRKLCYDNHVKFENVINRPSIVTLQVGVNPYKGKEGTLPWFELAVHSMSFEKIFKDFKSNDTGASASHDADVILGMLTEIKEDDMKIVETKIKPPSAKKTGKPY